MFVLVAVVAMLAGAVLLILAREPFVADVQPGETVEVFVFEAPEWDPFGYAMEARIFGPANVTFFVQMEPQPVPGQIVASARDVSGDSDVEANRTEHAITAFEFVHWQDKAQAGERWVLQVTNGQEEPLRVSGSVSAHSNQWIGGALVAVGILGFVFYRMGMRRSG